jgi:uncharacterized protein YpbB
MIGAPRQLMTSDVRRMRELYSQNVPVRRIAELTGFNRRTVEKYVCEPEMYGRAHRYADFVERAARWGFPMLVPPSPF